MLNAEEITDKKRKVLRTLSVRKLFECVADVTLSTGRTTSLLSSGFSDLGNPRRPKIVHSKLRDVPPAQSLLVSETLQVVW
jgi:hypothetical protein